ncbi:hypothetical protein BGZ95_008640 [Linnemannia exigua]|uniref:Uncharacterized protein n=1 Tax=Linnemannia exigua TaxID=604196 RepID=A0AAD4DE70_9FUNG|nr:hypothetical protein BGZ95_008640 [Linnemannia exigua]
MPIVVLSFGIKKRAVVFPLGGHLPTTSLSYLRYSKALHKIIIPNKHSKMNISTVTISIAKSDQDIQAVSVQLSSHFPEPADRQASTTEAQTKTEPQSTEGDSDYKNDRHFQEFLRRFGGKRKGRK